MVTLIFLGVSCHVWVCKEVEDNEKSMAEKMKELAGTDLLVHCDINYPQNTTGNAETGKNAPEILIMSLPMDRLEEEKMSKIRNMGKKTCLKIKIMRKMNICVGNIKGMCVTLWI